MTSQVRTVAVGTERKNVLRWYDPVTDWMWEVRPTEGRIQEEAQVPGGGGGWVDCYTGTWMEEAGSGRHGGAGAAGSLDEVTQPSWCDAGSLNLTEGLLPNL